MGAYLSLYIDVPMLPLALVLTVILAFKCIWGKETAFHNGFCVGPCLNYGLLSLEGVEYLRALLLPEMQKGTFNWAGGFASTVGLVFVSYAGLTKVASILKKFKIPIKQSL